MKEITIGSIISVEDIYGNKCKGEITSILNNTLVITNQLGNHLILKNKLNDFGYSSNK
ncbi:hypothetical protein [Enterococcus hirae]|uniref:hypothetical protein n=1 Tax=Enterococcus hirae TaxID=1354 RepID=UPI001A968A74|nr:hypothetical protein [Enterococcus hirae]